jgi:hypothetical protein
MYACIAAVTAAGGDKSLNDFGKLMTFAVNFATGRMAHAVEASKS